MKARARKEPRQTAYEPRKSMRELVSGGYCLKSTDGTYVTYVPTDLPLGVGGLYLTHESLLAAKFNSEDEARELALTLGLM